MDLMTRRAVLMGMAQGCLIQKGSFTVSSGDEGYNKQISFGKTVNKYIAIFEMTNESKEILAGRSDVSGLRAFTWVGIYPLPSIANKEISDDAYVARINPSTQAVNATINRSMALYNDKVRLSCYVLKNGGSAWGLYQGLSYNYWIFEMK